MRNVRLHKIDSVCSRKRPDSLVFDSRRAAEVVATVPGYELCPRCWKEGA